MLYVAGWTPGSMKLAVVRQEPVETEAGGVAASCGLMDEPGTAARDGLPDVQQIILHSPRLAIYARQQVERDVRLQAVLDSALHWQ